VPKGVLLNGPPGTGKTLLGRAVAGEAGVPFFSISGSEFIQMFVGVGASRVRDMFQTAKDNAPSILFIDEIDAVGRHRGTGLGGGHDEREQTLNQILSEMDGFTQTESVIVMAATNRPDVLDPALLRPGRFDRHVTVDRPNYKGRLAIFRVHCRGVPLAADVELERMAAGTVGLTGADIRNLVNEAALWATRNGKDAVDMLDFEYARDKVLMGAKREEVLTGKEKLMTAYHEAGHALLVWLTQGGDRLHKVTIIPRGRALGVTQVLPEEDRLNISESELHARLAFLLGGRAAEKIEFHEFSAGAEDDLKQATNLARRMVTHWGMSERLGPVAFRSSEHHPFLGRDIAEPREFSENTAKLIDEEIVRILRAAADKAEQILRGNQDKLLLLATTLDREEVLDERQIAELIGPAAYRPATWTKGSQPQGSSDALPAEPPADGNGAKTDPKAKQA
jgi:cell division protease FtsH